MAEVARVGRSTALRRDAILEAVAFAAETLLLRTDWLTAADEVMARLGIAADVSRAYLIENSIDADGSARCLQISEWCAPGVAPQAEDPALDGSSTWTQIGFGRWAAELAAGVTIHGSVSDLPDSERAALRAQDIVSLASFPIFVDGTWWGCVGFDDCIGERDWAGAELEALRAAAGVVGAAISRSLSQEQALAAESRYRSLVEDLPAITYTDINDPVSDTGRIGFISPQIEQLLGYPPERFTGDRGSWFEVVHPDDRGRIVGLGAKDSNLGQIFEEEYRMIAADGSEVWVHDTMRLVATGVGSVEHWQGFLVDITARKEAEQQLRLAEERYRELVEHLPAVAYIESLDASPEAFYISPQVEEIFGYTAQEWTWTPDFWIDHVHPDDRERALEVDEDSNISKLPYSYEYRFLKADGSWSWVRDEATFLRGRGEDGFWQGFLLDITERKEAETGLARALGVEREATKRLRALDEMKNTFLQAVSHDLRTPLAAILGLAVTLERGDVQLEEADARDLARRIAENSRKLDRLVTNLLDLDRLARGIVEPKLHETDAGALVRRALEESDLLASSRVQMDIDSVIVSVDGAKLERIVENLLANTSRHTPSNSTIWIRVKPLDDGVLLMVEDDGPGVPEELREAIFEPFRQGPDAPQHSPGVGVGLALVSRFAQLHGGRAWVQERTGGGASFRVWIPDGAPKQFRLPVG